MKDDRGMTLLEVVISMAVVFIVFLGMSAGGIVVIDQNLKSAQRDEAVSVAEGEMQSVRNTPFASLADNTSTVTRTVRGRAWTYTVTRDVTTLDTAGLNRQVSINVAWNRLENGVTKTYNHQVFTIVRQR